MTVKDIPLMGSMQPRSWAGAALGTWKGRIAVVVVVALLAGAVAYRKAGTQAAPGYQTRPVTRGTVTAVVLVPGAIDPYALVKLGFKTGGRVADIPVTAGQHVAAGQAVARLDDADLKLAQSQAQANVAAAQAKYDLTAAGAPPQDIAVAQQSVDNAKRSLDETQRTTANDLATAQQALASLRSAYSSAQGGFQLLSTAVPSDIGTYVAGIDNGRFILATATTDFTTMSTADITTAKGGVGQADAALANAQPIGAQLTQTLTDWTSARDGVIAAWLQFDGAIQRGTDTSGAAVSYRSAQLAYVTATTRLSNGIDAVAAQVTAAQQNAALAQNALNSSTSRTSPDLDKVRADLTSFQASAAGEVQLAGAVKGKLGQMSGHLATISDAIGGSYVAAQQAVTNAQQRGTSSVQSAQGLYDAAVTSLARTAAPARSFDIAAAYAAVLVQQAALDKAASDLTNATLVAPVGGSIAQVAAHAGEQVAATVPVVVLSDTTKVTFHGTVGEADLAKLRLDQTADVTIDARARSAPLAGKITSIDPVATVQQGVPVYGVDFTIAAPDPSVQTGMTGTASVPFATKENVNTVPSAAIHIAQNGPFVDVLENGQPHQVSVHLGLAGTASTEVTDGLTQGQLVIVSRSGPASGGLSASAPLAYPAPTEPTLERVAVVIEVTNTSPDDLQVTPTDFLVRDEDHRVYPSDPQAAIADARIVRATASFAGMNGVQPLPTITLRQGDVVSGFVVYSVPAGVRPTQLVWRQTDSDRVVDLPSR